METNHFLVLETDAVPDGLAEFREKHIYPPGRLVPLHTTLLAGIVTPEVSETEALLRVAAVCNRCPAFVYEAVCVSAFPTSRVLWLAPIPVSPFERLVDALYEAFPDLERNWQFPTFHMTISVSKDAAAMEMALQEFQSRFAAKLPWQFEARGVSVWLEQGEEYQRVAVYPLA